MENFNRKSHWENIYESKPLESVSWYQPNPETSLHFVHEFHIPKTAKIIDVGGGDSFFVDRLLDDGYEDVTVLDISQAAIERAKLRLGDRAGQVKWIVTDVTEFIPQESYDFWHDRAAFHFLTKEEEIKQYIAAAVKAVSHNGILVVGTFSDQGPLKCSGIDIRQYTERSMTEAFGEFFQKTACMTVDHRTPFNTEQNFLFCSFRKK